jgi:APA family basic amino acid/polyamine antiporter
VQSQIKNKPLTTPNKTPMANILDEKGHAGAGDMKKTLGSFNLTMLGIGAIIGTGIFVLTGTAAANHAGPALVLSFVFSGLGCAFAGLCYAEFASMIPSSGSAYAYAKATMGVFVAWIIGWDLILEYLFGAATVAVGWSGYVVSFLHDLGIQLPPTLTASTGTRLIDVPGQGWQPWSQSLETTLNAKNIVVSSLPQTAAVFNLPAMIIIALMTMLLIVGIKESANFNNIIVVIKIIVILLFLLLCFGYINPANWTPFIPDRTTITDATGHQSLAYGIPGIVSGAAVIFFAYIGFDAVSTVAQETKNPQRDMPIGILLSLAICTVLYILVSLVMTGVVHYTELNVPAPVAMVLDRVNGQGANIGWLKPIIKVGAIAGLSSVVLVMLLGQPRIFWSMASDGLLPKTFARLHPKYQTPYVTTILTGVVAGVVAGIMPIGLLGELVSIGTLMAFVIVCIGIIILRRTAPDMHRPFRTPLVPIVPILGAAICLYQMIALPTDTWIRLIVWMAIGLVIYFAWGKANYEKVNSK